MNKVVLCGYLGQDSVPEYTPAGKAYWKNSLGITKRFKNNKRQDISYTTWVNIVVFGKAAEIAYLYFPKGSQFLCEGEIASSTYTDETGKSRTTHSVIVRGFEFIGKKDENAKKQTAQQKPLPQKPQSKEESEEAKSFDNIDIETQASEQVPF